MGPSTGKTDSEVTVKIEEIQYRLDGCNLVFKNVYIFSHRN